MLTEIIKDVDRAIDNHVDNLFDSLFEAGLHRIAQNMGNNNIR